jgi:hypothetical protein
MAQNRTHTKGGRHGGELVDVRGLVPEAEQQRGEHGDAGGREVQRDELAHEVALPPAGPARCEVRVDRGARWDGGQQVTAWR